MSLHPKISLVLSLGLMLFTNLSGASEKGFSQVYSTPLIKENAMACSRPDTTVFAKDGGKLTTLCAQDYSECRFNGTCVFESKTGQLSGIYYYRTDKETERSLFKNLNMDECPYGYGMAQYTATKAASTCLIPYYSVAADPMSYKAGDVLFIPQLKGVLVPSGEAHDGYVIVADYSQNSIDSGSDRLVFFEGYKSLNTKNNNLALTAAGFDNPDNAIEISRVSKAKAAEIRKKRGFKITVLFKNKFSPIENPMLEGGL